MSADDLQVLLNGAIVLPHKEIKESVLVRLRIRCHHMGDVTLH